LEINAKAKSGDWKAKLKTTGLSDLHVVEVTIQPGRTLGWHSHPEPSFVAVKSGTATFYEADDPTCTPRVFPTRSKLFEPGSGAHIVRNEGSVPLVNVVVQLIPTGAPRLVSEPTGNCPSGLGAEQARVGGWAERTLRLLPVDSPARCRC
jgi:hypothetical protein